MVHQNFNKPFFWWCCCIPLFHFPHQYPTKKGAGTAVVLTKSRRWSLQGAAKKVWKNLHFGITWSHIPKESGGSNDQPLSTLQWNLISDLHQNMKRSPSEHKEQIFSSIWVEIPDRKFGDFKGIEMWGVHVFAHTHGVTDYILHVQGSAGESWYSRFLSNFVPECWI